MKRLSVNSFEQYLSQLTNYLFVLDSDNQNSNYTCNYVLKFNAVECFPFIRTIIFRNNDSFMQLSSIKNIIIKDRDSIAGIIVNIVCEDNITGNELNYKFIIDKGG